jgi:thiol:disulfide interchange protein DsbC
MRRIAPYIYLSLIILLGCANSATSVKELPEKELDEQRAEMALKTLDPKIQVLSVKPTPIEGLFEVVAQSDNKKGIIYLDSKGENAFFGSIVEVATKTNITKLSIDEINKVDFSSIPLGDTLVMGDPDAPYKVVVFDDPD